MSQKTRLCQFIEYLILIGMTYEEDKFMIKSRSEYIHISLDESGYIGMNISNNPPEEMNDLFQKIKAKAFELFKI